MAIPRMSSTRMWYRRSYLKRSRNLLRDEYKVDEILDETFLDLDEIIRFLEETRKFHPKHDDKLQKLIRLLNSKDLTDRKVLVFTEFSDTARYIAKYLTEAGIDGLEQIDSASKKDRADVIARFSPYYNGSSSGELATGRTRSGADLNGRPVGRVEPAGRHPDDQLRHPLEPRSTDAAYRSSRPPDEPGDRAV